MGSEMTQVVEDLKSRINKLTLDRESLVAQVSHIQLKLDQALKRIAELEIENEFWKRETFKQLGLLTSSSSLNDSSRLTSGEDKGDEFSIGTFIEQLVTTQSEYQNRVKVLEENSEKMQREKEREMDRVLQECFSNAEMCAKECEGLIRDILANYMGQMKEMKKKFEKEVKAKPELKDGKGLREKFLELPKKMWGIAVAAFAAIKAATAGWASWGFVSWLWDKIYKAVQKLYKHSRRIAGVLTAGCKIADSESFQNFMKAWSEGKTFGQCLAEFATSTFLKEALKLGPEVLNNLFAKNQTPEDSSDDMV